jgi:formate dehydrogenase iron-sulfur subunit
MTKAMLIDLSKCIGCRSCQAACKQWHDLPAEITHNQGTYQNPPQASAKTLTFIAFHEVEYQNKFHWIFAKNQCMHCEHPACVSACTVGALTKTPEGPVIYDADTCIGCRYCEYACPFDVPKYDWESPLGLINKCDMCYDRIQDGEEPACAKACPTDAILYGERDDLLAQAKKRIAENPDKYVNHIYGEHEVGGTNHLYISPVPFSEIGFPDVGTEVIPRYAEAVVKQTPTIAVGMAAAASGLFWFLNRREKNMKLAEKEDEEVKG